MNILNLMEQEPHRKKYKLTIDRSDFSHGRRDTMMESMIASGAMCIHNVVHSIYVCGCNTCTHTTEERIHASRPRSKL